MKEVAQQLNKLITINRQIINQLHKDEADIELLQQRFKERGSHTEKLSKAASDVDKKILTKKEKETLKNLFDRFAKQQGKIDTALDYILKESKERLNNAIKSNKAEKSYQLLKR